MPIKVESDERFEGICCSQHQPLVTLTRIPVLFLATLFEERLTISKGIEHDIAYAAHKHLETHKHF